MKTPAVRPEVEHRILGREVVLFHAPSRRTYRLDALAGLVFFHCDGEHTEESIVENVLGYVDGVSAERLAAEVSGVLDRLEKDGVIDRTTS
jgi:hypothetical protein